MRTIVVNTIYFLLSPILIRRGRAKGIYLTFDDGPHAKNTSNILTTLSQFDCKATFFMVGSEMVKYPNIVREVISAGHNIGYHSYYHNSLKESSATEVLSDFRSMERLSKYFNYSIRLYRPPYGDLSLLAIVLAWIRNYKIIMWSMDSRDSYDQYEKILETISPVNLSDGEIILFHDDYEVTTKLLKDTLKIYNENNISCCVFI